MKRRIKILANSLASVAIACVAGLCFAGCVETTSWDVSKNGDATVTAKILKNADAKYTLKIEGNGEMLNWSSTTEVPWSKKADQINKVNVGDSIKNIGDNAFTSTQITSLVLPRSVDYVGSNAIPEDAGYFVYDTVIEYAEEDARKIYTYQEEMPETNFWYWQQDVHSNTDIFNKNNPDELFEKDGDFWHYDEEDNAVSWNKIRILFIGNSFTYTNKVPEIFNNIAKDMGYYIETYSITGPGWYLENHAKATDACGEQVDLLLNARNDFDYIVLQEQSTCAFTNYQRFLTGVQNLKQKIDATQTNAQIYLYSTWGYLKSAPSYGYTIPQMELAVRQGYENAALATEVNLSHVGKAFTKLYQEGSSINLYASDNHHQSYEGSYLGACVHVATILGGDVRETQYSGNITDEAVLQTLRYTAYEVANGAEVEVEMPEEDEGETEQNSNELVIAGWGRFITETRLTNLTQGFKQYCDANGIEYENITYTYYQGATTSQAYYYIASFTAKVKTDGNVDVILPCADNMKDNITVVGDLIPVEVYGQTGRRVAALNDDELTKAFLIYVQTQQAADILVAA